MAKAPERLGEGWGGVGGIKEGVSDIPTVLGRSPASIHELLVAPQVKLTPTHSSIFFHSLLMHSSILIKYLEWV